jgi:hypothetical protein
MRDFEDYQFNLTYHRVERRLLGSPKAADETQNFQANRLSSPASLCSASAQGDE